MGQVYASQGSPIESAHYFQQGLEIASSNSAEIFITKFNVALSDISCRRHQLEKSQELFALATAEGLMPRDAAGVDACKGHILSSEKEFVKAVGEYNHAVGVLEEAMRREYVKGIDEGLIETVEEIKPVAGKRFARGKTIQKTVVKKPTESQGFLRLYTNK